jgi:hypothetical protein
MGRYTNRLKSSEDIMLEANGLQKLANSGADSLLSRLTGQEANNTAQVENPEANPELGRSGVVHCPDCTDGLGHSGAEPDRPKNEAPKQQKEAAAKYH